MHVPLQADASGRNVVRLPVTLAPPPPLTESPDKPEMCPFTERFPSICTFPVMCVWGVLIVAC